MIIDGDFLAINSDAISDVTAWQETGGGQHKVMPIDDLQFLNTNEDSIRALPDGLGFITSGTDISDLYLYHYDGTSSAFASSGITGAVTALASSADGSTVAFLTTTANKIAIYDTAALTLTAIVTASNTLHSSYSFVALNDDGTKVCVSVYNSFLETYIVATQALDVASGSGINVRGLAANGADWVVLDADEDIFSFTAAGVLTEEISNALTGTFNYGKNFVVSPDGTVLIIGGHTPTGSMVAVKLSDFTTYTVTAPPEYETVYAWRDDNTLYAFNTYASGVHKVYKFNFDGTNFDPYEHVGYNSFSAKALGRFVPAAAYKIDGTIIDTTEESQFIVTAMYPDTGVVAGKVTLADGILAFSVPVNTANPLMVVISGIAEKFHQVDHPYDLNEIIIVQDTDYSYICTTAGTTAITKPAYPTSGTITDGSAVFTVRGKVAKPTTNYFVYPVPV